MKRRPWVLIVLAVFHFLAPIGNVIFNALLMKKNVLDYLIYAMGPQYLKYNWYVFVVPIVAGIAIYACKKWSFFVYLLSVTTLFIFSYTGYLSKAGSVGLAPVIFVYFVNIVIVAYFLLPAVREVYFNPRLRWWESKPRYKADFKAQWSKESEDSRVTGVIGNFSVNGLFFKADQFPEDGSTINIYVDNGSGEVVFEGMAIHHGAQNTVGFGVQFNHNKESQVHAKNIVVDLDKRGMRINTREPGQEDTFVYWLKEFLTKGQGILPKKDS